MDHTWHYFNGNASDLWLVTKQGFVNLYNCPRTTQLNGSGQPFGHTDLPESLVHLASCVSSDLGFLCSLVRSMDILSSTSA